jgi:glucosamine kinase
MSLSLGIDSGGTSTRWAVADASGRVVHEGVAASMSGTMLGKAEGDAHLTQTVATIAQSASAYGSVGRVLWSLTGYGDPNAQMPLTARWLSAWPQLQPHAIDIRTDSAWVHQAHFAQGGLVVYAGTGSYASWQTDAVHTVGGRGLLLDDAGGGAWIGLQLLRAAWRDEELRAATKGARTHLAEAVFAALGSDQWLATRSMLYAQDLSHVRGALTALCQAAVVLNDAGDVRATQILQSAGAELWRLLHLAWLQTERAETQAIASGGVLTRLPGVFEALQTHAEREAPTLKIERSSLQLHVEAAKRAALMDS